MTVPEFVPMGVGQILDRTFRLYRQNFVRFLAIVSVVRVPVALILTIILMLMLGGTVLEGEAGRSALAGAAAVTGLVGMFLNLVALTLCQGALFKSVSESYLGNEVTVGQAYGFALPKLGRMIWASLVVGVVVVIGMVLLVVPGVIFALMFALVIPVIIVENLKTGKAMKRSRTLVSGNMGRVFVLGFLIFIIAFVVGLASGYVGRWAAAALAPSSFWGTQLITQMSSLVGNILVAPIGAAAYVLLYYDLRIRKEGFDLEMLARSMGSEEAPVDAAPPTP